MFEVVGSTANSINYGYAGAFISFWLFILNSCYLLPIIAPRSAKETEQKLWKWRNTVNSLVHSCITGSGSFLNLLVTPELSEDVIGVHNNLSVVLNSVTVGYFIYDFYDLAVNNKHRIAYELLLHHAVVTVCFGLALVTRMYQGFAMISLLVEVNSIFLHIRQLYILENLPKTDCKYRTVVFLNLGSFLAFRLIPLGWQMRWLTRHKDLVAYPVYILGCTTLTLILILNLGLLGQLIYKDFIKKGTRERTHAQ